MKLFEAKKMFKDEIQSHGYVEFEEFVDEIETYFLSYENADDVLIAITDGYYKDDSNKFNLIAANGLPLTDGDTYTSYAYGLLYAFALEILIN